MLDEELSSFEEKEFDWNEYLEKTCSEAAPNSCFAQHIEPPVNDFKVGYKLETNDPRNASSTCLATVIEIAGPRLRLRLDGTDDRNDFWLLCDSDMIHPFEHSAKHGRKIQPPLGYGNDISKWPKFLEKLIHTAGENVFAPETCFKTPPIKPMKNEFKIGQKIEAVDPKNPYLICPATIKDIKRDKLFISFDGWSHSSQFWCSFNSRDLFPCGWCKKSGHLLQPPGDLEEKTATNLKSTPKINANINFTANSKRKNLNNSSSVDSLSSSSLCSSNLNATIDSNLPLTIPVVNLVETPISTANINSPGPTLQQKTPIQNSVEHIQHSKQSKVKQPLTQKEHENCSLSKIDLSIIKTEKIDPLDEPKPPVIPLASSSLSQNKTVTVYLSPNADCGKLVNTTKFHLSHRQFGPGTPMDVFKSILQTFVDCALSRTEIMKLIPEGTDSENYVKYKTLEKKEKKQIPFVKSEAEMWSKLKAFCQKLSIDDSKLFCKRNVQQAIRKHSTNQIQMPSSSASSTSSEISTVTPNVNNKKFQPTSGSNRKRPSASELPTNYTIVNYDNDFELANSTDPNISGPIVAKQSKLDYQQPLNQWSQMSKWSVDQVGNFISEVSDKYFASYSEIFKQHEIDGKALLLLTTDILTKYMGFKLGPALKLNNYLDKIRQNRFSTSLSEK